MTINVEGDKDKNIKDVINLAKSESNPIKPGDLMYFRNDEGEHHTIIISKIDDSKIYYAGHSNDRLDQDLNTVPLSEATHVIVVRLNDGINNVK